MRKITADGIKKYPINALKNETTWMLKELCRQQAEVGLSDQDLLSKKARGEKEALELEAKLKQLDARLTNGFTLIAKKLNA